MNLRVSSQKRKDQEISLQHLCKSKLRRNLKLNVLTQINCNSSKQSCWRGSNQNKRVEIQGKKKGKFPKPPGLNILVNAYNSMDYANLNVSTEISELFKVHITLSCQKY